MSRFNLREDWKYICWKATLLTNLYRSIAAGFALMILSLIIPMDGGGQQPIWVPLSFPVTLPLVYFAIFMPIGLVASLLSRMGVPYVGLISIVCGFIIIPGDPVLWIFDKITKNQIVPTKDLAFISLAIIYYVVDEERKAAALS